MPRLLEMNELYLPHWLVRGVLASFDPGQNMHSLKSISESQLILPPIDRKFGSLLASKLGLFQEAILHSNSLSRIQLNVPGLVADSAGFIRGNDSKFNIVFSLSGLKLICRNEHGFQTLPLFKAESFEGFQCDKVNLGLQKYTADIILGYFDPYNNLDQNINRKALMDKFSDAPLALWKSLWLELTGIERIFYLSIEQQMQWACSLVHLDGTYSMPIEKLRILSESYSYGRGHTKSKSKMILLLKRLGKKFAEHGLLRQQVIKAPILAEESSDFPALLWSASEEKKASLVSRKYSSLTAKYFANRFLHESNLQDFLQILGVSQNLLNASDLEVLANYIQKEEVAFLKVRYQNNLCLYNVVSLFLETYLRYSSHNRSEIPREYLGLFSDSIDNKLKSFEEKFESFTSCIKGHNAISDLLAHSKGASIFAPIYSEEFSKNIAKLDSSPLQMTTSVSSEVNKESISSGLNASKDLMYERKDAAVLIEELRQHSMSLYNEVVDRYIQSLDTEAQRLIIDVRERMQKKTFEEHMRQRLVRFLAQDKKLKKEILDRLDMKEQK